MLNLPGIVSYSNALVFALASSVMFVFIRLRRNHGSQYPPGPQGWPIVGNILKLSLGRAWDALTSLGTTYGDVMFFHGLGNRVLVLSSIEAINDLFDKRANTYSDRPVFTVVGELMGLDQSMPLKPYGEEWRKQRKLAHIALNPTAVKKYYNLQEDLALRLCKDIMKCPDDFFSFVRLAAGRIVLSVTYGLKVETAQSKFITMAEETMALIGKATVPGAYLCDLIPKLKYLPTWVPFRREAAMGKVMIESFVSEPWNHCRERLSLDNAASPSLVGDFLAAEDNLSQDVNILKWAAGSMYGAGAETTYSTVLTCIMAMALHPEKQAEVHAELDRIVGAQRFPQLQDRGHLPYLEAVIKETARWHPVLPLGIARVSKTDDYFRGFYIPKGTIVMPNVWAIAFSPCEKYSPQSFIPERFLDKEVQQVDPSIWNFGFGRRVCPGKALAENSVFILIANLLWAFKISVKDSEPLVPRFSDGLVSYPEPFKCDIVPRTEKHKQLIEDSVLDYQEHVEL